MRSTTRARGNNFIISFELYWPISLVYLNPSWAIFCCIWLSLPISGYLGFSSGYLSQSLIISVCLRPVKDESLGLVSVSRLKVPRLLVSSRSHTKFLNWSRLGLILDEKFWDSFVLVLSRLHLFYSVLSRSHFFIKSWFSSQSREKRHRYSLSCLGLAQHF